jgi:hypothetical protein
MRLAHNPPISLQNKMASGTSVNGIVTIDVRQRIGFNYSPAKQIK